MRPRLASNVSLGQEPMCARHYEGCAPQQNECTCRRWPYSSPRRRQALQYRGSVFRDAKHSLRPHGLWRGFRPRRGPITSRSWVTSQYQPEPFCIMRIWGTELSCTGLGGCPGPGSGRWRAGGPAGNYTHPSPGCGILTDNKFDIAVAPFIASYETFDIRGIELAKAVLLQSTSLRMTSDVEMRSIFSDVCLDQAARFTPSGFSCCEMRSAATFPARTRSRHFKTARRARMYCRPLFCFLLPRPTFGSKAEFCNGRSIAMPPSPCAAANGIVSGKSGTLGGATIDASGAKRRTMARGRWCTSSPCGNRPTP